MHTEWRVIPGLKFYVINQIGQVRRIGSKWLIQDEFGRACLRKGGDKFRLKIKDLVAAAFPELAKMSPDERTNLLACVKHEVRVAELNV